MKIETKYDIGQEVWMLLGGKPEDFVIAGIEYTRHRLFTGCKYYIKSTDCEYEVKMPEEVLFATKEELLKIL